jgi:phosphatidyl-myo-inositol dimannoside synthase
MAMDAKPRVLVVTPDFPPAHGGIQTLMHRLVTHARRLRCRVVALPAEGAGRFDSSERLDVRRSPFMGPDRRAAVIGLNGRALSEALRFRPDVVLSAHIVASPAAWAIGRLRGTPTVQYLHADELRGRPRLSRFAVTHADAVVAVSSYTERLALGAGAEAAKVHRILNGVDPIPNGAVGARSERPTLLTVARLDSPYKGLDVTMRALPLIRGRVPDARWIVVGDGRLRGMLEARARSLGVQDAVSFQGSVSDEERDRWLARSHVFVMPSRLPASGVGGEGFGIVYLEAGAHGLPVVAGNVGGAVDAVIHGETGLLVDPRDHVALANAVAGLLLDSDRARAIGSMGMRRAEELAWPNVVRRVEEVVLGVARGRR